MSIECLDLNYNYSLRKIGQMDILLLSSSWANKNKNLPFLDFTLQLGTLLVT